MNNYSLGLIALAFKESKSLRQIVAKYDFYERAIPRAEELREAHREFSQRGLAKLKRGIPAMTLEGFSVFPSEQMADPEQYNKIAECIRQFPICSDPESWEVTDEEIMRAIKYLFH
jgi:hypothetical protein